MAIQNRFSRAIIFLALLFSAHHLFALVAPDLGSPHSAEQRIATLEQQVLDAKASADNAWMLTSSALVLMMTGPGLALFYCGLVRKKNVLSTMMQSFAMMALITVLWTVCGYSLAFGGGSSFIGSFRHLFLHGVTVQPEPAYSSTIPQQTFMIYQLMFGQRLRWSDGLGQSGCATARLARWARFPERLPDSSPSRRQPVLLDLCRLWPSEWWRECSAISW